MSIWLIAVNGHDDFRFMYGCFRVSNYFGFPVEILQAVNVQLKPV